MTKPHNATHPKFWERTDKPRRTREEHMERCRMLWLEAERDETSMPAWREACKDAQRSGVI